MRPTPGVDSFASVDTSVATWIGAIVSAAVAALGQFVPVPAQLVTVKRCTPTFLAPVDRSTRKTVPGAAQLQAAAVTFTSP